MPEVIIKGLHGVTKEGNKLVIGALTKLSEITESKTVRGNDRVLADAAISVASPNIINMTTLGGNLAQEVRCGYFRYPKQIGCPLMCLRKGSEPCLEGGLSLSCPNRIGSRCTRSGTGKTAAEAFLKRRTIYEKTATQASELALKEAQPLRQNSYKVQIAKTLVKRAILSNL